MAKKDDDTESSGKKRPRSGQDKQKRLKLKASETVVKGEGVESDSDLSCENLDEMEE